KKIDEDMKDTPWWVPIASILFVPFFWALFYLISGVIELLLGALALLPEVMARNYSYLGAVVVVLIGGVIIFMSGIRKSIYFAITEGIFGVVSASYALLSLPEGGISAVVSVVGGMIGVADSIRRFAQRGAQQGATADS
ncbi:MAG: hypothetical protein AB2708_11235, partial [Candidatus Thiodiazotropha taylori]